MRSCSLLLALAGLGLASAAGAAPPSPSPAEPPWRYEAHLITVGPGSSALGRLGRSLITVGRVRPGRIENVVYDLGHADAEPGLLDYLAGRDARRVLRVGTVTRALSPFMAEGRRVEVQRLALAPAEIDSLRAALVAELQPPRQSYSSHPLGDTSATRARDVIDVVTGRAVRRGAAAAPQPGSMRELLRHELGGSLEGELVLDVFGGRALDHHVDAYAALFLPRRLRQVITELQRDGAPLSEAPALVHRGRPVSREPVHPASKLAWSWAALLAAVGLLAWRRLPRTRLAGAWMLLGPLPIGALGLGYLLLALRAHSPEVRTNELMLSFLGTDLLLLPVAWRWLRGRVSAGRPLLGYAGLRAALALVVLGGHATGLLFQQPRALLAPTIIASALLLGMVMRVRRVAGGA